MKCNFFLNYESFLRIFIKEGYGKVVKLMKIFSYFDPIYIKMDMNFHFEISVTSQPFWDWIDLKGAKFKLPWFSSPSFIVNTRVVILILDLINEVRNRLENQQKSWLKYYLSNISWAISKRGVHILILHFQEVGWLVGIFQTYQFEGDFNGAAFCNFKQNSIHKLILTDVSMR